jgi:hypothetical protein
LSGPPRGAGVPPAVFRKTGKLFHAR